MTSVTQRKLSELVDSLGDALDLADELCEQLDEYDDGELYDAVHEVRRAIHNYSDALYDYEEVL